MNVLVSLSSRVRAAAVVVTALATTLGGLAAAPPAAAHAADALHQHGWSSAQLMFGRGVFWCSENIPGFQTGTISHLMPDVMTTPGGSQTVYFTARIEYWDGSKPVTVASAPKPWWYTKASANGISHGWRELGTDHPAPQTFYWTSTWAGVFFRVHYYFYWGFDGTYFTQDVSPWCKV